MHTCSLIQSVKNLLEFTVILGNEYHVQLIEQKRAKELQTKSVHLSTLRIAYTAKLSK